LLPSEADVRSHLTRAIPLNIPIIASGDGHRHRSTHGDRHGAGGRHRRHSSQFRRRRQAAQVRQVKKFESGMVVNPLTIGPDATLVDALTLMKDHGISGVPVVIGAGTMRPASWSAFSPTATCVSLPIRSRSVSELMTQENLVTVREGVSQTEAKRLLHQHRIEKLLVVDEQYRCVGLITVKDMEKRSLIRSPARMSRDGCVSRPRPRSAKRLCAHRTADRRWCRRRRRRYRARPFRARAGGGEPHQAAVERRAGRRGQCRNARKARRR
jgi:CBS domain-containing protein